MLKRFSARELVLIAITSAFLFVISISIGSGIVAVTGTPMAGGLITVFIMVYIFVLTALIIRKFGIVTLVTLIYTLLSIPTINMGPPGFYKVLIGLANGLIMDIILYTGRYKKFAYYLAMVAGMILSIPLMLFAMKLLGLPGYEKLLSMLFIAMLVYAIEAAIGVWLGILTYEKKLKKSKLVKSLRA